MATARSCWQATTATRTTELLPLDGYQIDFTVRDKRPGGLAYHAGIKGIIVARGASPSTASPAPRKQAHLPYDLRD
jgi:hypothetical protein